MAGRKPKPTNLKILEGNPGKRPLNLAEPQPEVGAIWQRKMVKALDKGIIAERFAEHDHRAKTASDTDLKHVASLLTHDDIKTTQKHYGRKAEIVRPLQ